MRWLADEIEEAFGGFGKAMIGRYGSFGDERESTFMKVDYSALSSFVVIRFCFPTIESKVVRFTSFLRYRTSHTLGTSRLPLPPSHPIAHFPQPLPLFSANENPNIPHPSKDNSLTLTD